MAQEKIEKPKVGERVILVLPEGHPAGAERVAEVIEVNAQGVITAKLVGDFKHPETGATVEYIERGAPYCSPESLKKKRRGNTWHWEEK